MRGAGARKAEGGEAELDPMRGAEEGRREAELDPVRSLGGGRMYPAGPIRFSVCEA